MESRKFSFGDIISTTAQTGSARALSYWCCVMLHLNDNRYYLIHQSILSQISRAKCELRILQGILQYVNNFCLRFYRRKIWNNRPGPVDCEFGPWSLFWFVHYTHVIHTALPTCKGMCSCVNDLSPPEYRKQNMQCFRLRNMEMCKSGFKDWVLCNELQLNVSQRWFWLPAKSPMAAILAHIFLYNELNFDPNWISDFVLISQLVEVNTPSTPLVNQLAS